jgi:glutaredoxin-like protein
MTEAADITVYGADWCSDCRRSKALLDAEGVDYDWIDVEADETAAAKALAISGRTSIPVVVFSDGAYLVEPSDEALKAKLAAV